VSRHPYFADERRTANRARHARQRRDRGRSARRARLTQFALNLVPPALRPRPHRGPVLTLRRPYNAQPDVVVADALLVLSELTQHTLAEVTQFRCPRCQW
jgi:hypothetical protein